MRRAVYFFIALLAGWLLLQSAYSLHWPIAHDEAPLFYEAFLMRSEGRVPYRDIFDFQMPGSYAAYYALGRLGGFDDFRIRILDLLILGTLLSITYIFMRRFGNLPALMAGLLFGLKYLQGGPSLSMQREYLLLLFIAAALWVGLRDCLTFKHRLSLGILFGLAGVIKPHAAIGLVPFLLFDIKDMLKRPGISLFNAAAKSIFPVALGFMIPIGLVLTWLAATDALIPFLTIAQNYWPLYAQINGALIVHDGETRMLGILDQVWRLGGYGLWLLPAALGVYLHKNKQVWLLASLALCYALYPALSGQFFPYHYIPFLYFIILLASLCIAPPDLRPSTFNSYLPSIILFLVILLNIRPSSTFLRQIQNQPIVTSTDRAVEIARFLNESLEEGDLVQPLDWTGGSLLAMLETRTPIATPYVFDFYFYHHVSDPYIQSLRVDFMQHLQESRPRFIIEVLSVDKPWVAGADTSREFPALRRFIAENYDLTLYKEDYVIYELK
jgi:hypothetical protein